MSIFAQGRCREADSWASLATQSKLTGKVQLVRDPVSKTRWTAPEDQHMALSCALHTHVRAHTHAHKHARPTGTHIGTHAHIYMDQEKRGRREICCPEPGLDVESSYLSIF